MPAESLGQSALRAMERERKEAERFKVAVRRALAAGLGSVELVGFIREVGEELRAERS